jgi:phosphoglycerol transferase MdoB-like AlkP superfamily enzyme
MVNKSLSKITIFVKIYLLGIFIFSAFRLLLFILNEDKVNDNEMLDVFRAFIMGVRFDIVISGYILSLPFLFISIFTFFSSASPIIKKVIFYYVFVLYTYAFFICSIDIPYFAQFSSRFSVSALAWMDSPLFIVKMVFQEPVHILYILLFVLVITFFYKILKIIFSNDQYFKKTDNIFLHLVLSILSLCFIFLGIRGRIEKKSPILVGTSYITNNPFLNQLGLNPNFTFITSYLEEKDPKNQEIKLMDEHLALKNVSTYFNIPVSKSLNPFSREVGFNSTDTQDKKNIVLIIMESMSASKMKRHGNTDNLTPFLDSISNEGYYFENTYSSGIHTFNGIFGTLFSFPAIYRQQPMKDISKVNYDGIASSLKRNGYTTNYFTTHDGQFDNVEGFLRANDFQNIISQKDYPSDQVKSALGVSDEYMFDYSIPILNELHAQKKYFFTTFMTASDHVPYIIPDNFKPKNNNIKQQIVEYADYSLRTFLTKASKQPWFKNTLFVFVADHGAVMNSPYEIPLDYVHSPLLFYAPGFIEDKKVFSKMAGQIDVFPSIMGLLKLNYVNRTLGINLFSETRPYIYFSADDKFGVIDTSKLLIVRKDNSIEFFDYKIKNAKIKAVKDIKLINKMRNYAASNLQSFQYYMKKSKNIYHK